METLSKVVCVQVRIETWQARAKLRSEDLRNVKPGDLPPETLATLGSKQLCHREAIAWQTRIKKRVERGLTDLGTRFMGGWAIPADRVDEARELLDAQKAEFEDNLKTLLNNLAELNRKWLAENDRYADIIRRDLKTEEYVRDRVHFRYHLFQVIPVGETGDHENSIAEEAESLGDCVLRDVTRAANEYWERTLAGRDTVTQRALSPLWRLLDKLDGMSIVDMRIGPLADSLREALCKLPDKGKITGNDLNILHGIALRLTTPERVIEQGGTKPVSSEIPAQMSTENLLHA